MAALRFQDFACLGTLFLFALVSAKTRNIALQDGDLTGTHLLQKIAERAELMEAEKQFHQFQKDFQRNYATEQERQRRFEIFRNNMKKVKELNELEEGTAVYGATIFADLTSDELPIYQAGWNFTSELEDNLPMAEIPDTYKLPKEFDWRLKNVVTPVKDNLKCGANWAFFITQSMESQYAIKYNKLLTFSEQQLLDCVTENYGCTSGRLFGAILHVQSMGGLQLEKDYPYVGKVQKCNFEKNLVKAKLLKYAPLPRDELVIAKYLVEKGPIPVLLNSRAMIRYKGGVSRPPASRCDPDKLNHSAIIVGYGEERDPETQKLIPYWIIKNNWGSKWGEKGYYRLYRGSGVCGIDNWAAYITVLKP